MTKSIRAEVAEALGSLKTQTRITWGLLVFVLTTLIGVAFKVFAGGGLP